MSGVNSSTAMSNRLRQLLDDCEGLGKHDQAVVLIAACIDEGWNTRSKIIGELGKLGLHPGHIAIVLDSPKCPVVRMWRRTGEGAYELLH